MIKGVLITDLQKKSDERGWFLKIFDGSEDFRSQLVGDVYFVCGLDKGKRGNHYHNVANEWFSIIKGNCSLYLEDIITGEKNTFELSDLNPKLIFVPNKVAHVFYSDNSEEFIICAFTDCLFDPTDTIKFDLTINEKNANAK